MDKKKKTMIISLVLLGIVFIIVGSTFSYYIWRTSSTENTNIVFTAGGGFSCAADGGGNLTENDLNLVPTYVDEASSGNYIKREVKVKPTIDVNDKKINMDLWLDINELGSGLSSSVNFNYAFTTSSTSNTEGVVASGNFNGKKAGDKIILLDSKEYASTVEETYYLWIWLGSEQKTLETVGQPFNLSLGGTCSDMVLPKVYVDLGDWGGQFKADEYIEKITKVEFVEGINVPEGATTFDLGASPSATTDVKGWLIDDGSGNETYILKIGSNGKIYAKSLSDAFRNMTNLKDISFDNLDTSETTNMTNMFFGCSSLTSLDLSNFDTSKVTNMSWMFSDCSSLTSLDLSNFDTSNVTDMSYMFNGCRNLNNIYVSSLWNTDEVTSSNYMFNSCSKLSNYNSSVIDKTNAHYNTGGYLTYKAYPAS